MPGAAHGRNQPVTVKGLCSIRGNDLAVAHDNDAVGILQHLAKHMRNQNAATTTCHEAAHKGEQLSGSMRVKRGGGLIQNDEVERIFGNREGTRDLHHLSPANRKIRDDV